MDQFTCLIVDDEPIAREIIQNYCRQIPYLTVLASSGNAMEAKAILHRQKIDILFLDINMPVLDGVSFLKTLKNPPQVIFTTAYKEYAIDAFELAACDYLLKPFSLERFVIAVDKAVERLQPTRPAGAETVPEPAGDYIFVKAEGKIFKISFEDLLYAEARGNYTRIVTTRNVLMPAMTFSGFEDLLPAQGFVRVHRSFIINKSRIDHIEGNRLFISGTEIPIGSNYREGFLRALGLG